MVLGGMVEFTRHAAMVFIAYFASFLLFSPITLPVPRIYYLHRPGNFLPQEAVTSPYLCHISSADPPSHTGRSHNDCGTQEIGRGRSGNGWHSFHVGPRHSNSIAFNFPLRILTTLLLPREKILKLDARSREYDITVIGEEAHLAYNRVGLTSFFEHRKIENLYLNSEDWV
jgi:hypothetical protein